MLMKRSASREYDHRLRRRTGDFTSDHTTIQTSTSSSAGSASLSQESGLPWPHTSHAHEPTPDISSHYARNASSANRNQGHLEMPHGVQAPYYSLVPGFAPDASSALAHGSYGIHSRQDFPYSPNHGLTSHDVDAAARTTSVHHSDQSADPYFQPVEHQRPIDGYYGVHPGPHGALRQPQVHESLDSGDRQRGLRVETGHDISYPYHDPISSHQEDKSEFPLATSDEHHASLARHTSDYHQYPTSAISMSSEMHHQYPPLSAGAEGHASTSGYDENTSIYSAQDHPSTTPHESSFGWHAYSQPYSTAPSGTHFEPFSAVSSHHPRPEHHGLSHTPYIHYHQTRENNFQSTGQMGGGNDFPPDPGFHHVKVDFVQSASRGRTNLELQHRPGPPNWHEQTPALGPIGVPNHLPPAGKIPGDATLGDSESPTTDETAKDGSSSGSDPGPSDKPRGKAGAKPRRPFEPEKRKQTAETRKRRACIRCRIQKKRCEEDPTNPGGECRMCRSVSKESKKTIHQIACFRAKLSDVTLYRKGGLKLTKRWEGTELRDIADRINPSHTPTIIFTHSNDGKEFSVRVVQYKVQEGDATARFWWTREGGKPVRKRKELAHYCLANIHAASNDFRNHVSSIAGRCTRNRLVPGEMLMKEAVFNETYMMGMDHYSNLTGPRDVAYHSRQTGLLQHLFMLWFAGRYTTGRSWIVSDETLGMEAETEDPSYPLYGKVSLPRMILAQFDSINYTKLLSVHGKAVTKHLEFLFMQNQQDMWLTLYIATFMLLREASHQSLDRYRHARENYGGQCRYSIPAFVEELQASCNNILHHWHYYNCNTWPDELSDRESDRNLKQRLSQTEYNIIMEVKNDKRVKQHLAFWERYKMNNGKTDGFEFSEVPNENRPWVEYTGPQNKFNWDDEFYWVSQMFEDNWCAHPTYQREQVPVF